MTRAHASWWGACAVSLAVHAAIVLRAARGPSVEPEEPARPDEVLPVSLVGGAAPTESALPLLAPEQHSHAATPGVDEPIVQRRPPSAAHGVNASQVGTEGIDAPELASAVPRALIKAVVLMASHDGEWMQCARDGARLGSVHIATDGQGHMQRHDASSSSPALQETLSRALAYLSARTFASHDAQATFRVAARCSRTAPGAFELGDAATSEQATGHVLFDTGVRVDFEINAKK